MAIKLFLNNAKRIEYHHILNPFFRIYALSIWHRSQKNYHV